MLPKTSEKHPDSANPMKLAQAHRASGTHFPNPLPKPYRPAPLTLFSEVDATGVAIDVGTRHLWPAIGLKIRRERAGSARFAILAFPGLAEWELRHTQGPPIPCATTKVVHPIRLPDSGF